jgi:hypothetical protein
MIPHARARHVVVVAILLAGSALLWLLVRPHPHEFAPGLVPRATEPYGTVDRRGIRFQWLLPTDEAPVVVEVLDEDRKVVWRSMSSPTGLLQPSMAEVTKIPGGNAYWRPVAVPPGEAERPGSLAAFRLREN